MRLQSKAFRNANYEGGGSGGWLSSVDRHQTPHLNREKTKAIVHRKQALLLPGHFYMTNAGNNHETLFYKIQFIFKSHKNKRLALLHVNKGYTRITDMTGAKQQQWLQME